MHKVSLWGHVMSSQSSNDRYLFHWDYGLFHVFRGPNTNAMFFVGLALECFGSSDDARFGSALVLGAVVVDLFFLVLQTITFPFVSLYNCYKALDALFFFTR